MCIDELQFLGLRIRGMEKSYYRLMAFFISQDQRRHLLCSIGQINFSSDQTCILWKRYYYYYVYFTFRLYPMLCNFLDPNLLKFLLLPRVSYDSCNVILTNCQWTHTSHTFPTGPVPIAIIPILSRLSQGSLPEGCFRRTNIDTRRFLRSWYGW